MSTSLKISSLHNPGNQTSQKHLSVFIAGTGAVGGSLISQILELQHPQLGFSILGLCNSRQLCWAPEPGSELEELKSSDIPTSWDKIIQQLIEVDEPLIFVDATGSEEVARYYGQLLKYGVHISTPSKRANTFSQEYFNQLIRLSSGGTTFYKYETTVGAGLPVINTIQSLLQSGDRITEISGVVSGTMTYIFNQLQAGRPFSEIIRSAKEEGYSEPDPRDDLSGEDVARKFLILARTCGYTFEREDLVVESLVPKDLVDLPLNEFQDHLPEYNDHWKNRNARALVNGKRLRYTGSFSQEGIRVGIQEVSADSPLGGLKGTDNLIQIFSERYADSPVVIQGPGAGREVTAAGVLADLVEIGKSI